MDKDPCIHEILDDLPICKKVFEYGRKSKYRFHTPGHKGTGHGLAEILQIKNDVTEVDDLDNMLAPEGCIKESMDKLKAVFGSKKTYFVTTGATTAILSSIFAVKDFGKIAILRSSHVSIYNALEILSMEPYIIDDIDKFGRTKEVTEKLLEKALANKKIGSIVLTRPTYTGDCFEIASISKIVKKSGKLLVIDEAHGTHFHFSNLFPNTASKYADIFIDSAHKTLPTLTSGAFLSVTNEKLLKNLDRAYHLFHTTSPSYLILMSLEYGVHVYSKQAEEFKKLSILMLNLKARLLAKGISVTRHDDFTRFVIDTEKISISGRELDMRLAEKGVFCEYSTMGEVVCIFTLYDEEKTISAFGDIVIECVAQCGEIKHDKFKFPKGNESVMKYIKAVEAPSELVSFEKAEGRIAAKNFGIYPPCRPIAVAGEIITREIINYLDNPIHIYGVDNNKIRVVK